MAKKFGIVAALCFVLALSFALVGCGGSVDKSKYTGDWKLASSSSADLDADSIELMKSLGLEVTLTLNDDGTGTLDMFGEQKNLSWEATSNTDGKLKMGDAETSIKLADSQLPLADVDGASLTFSR